MHELAMSPETAASKIVEEINRHELSGTDVPPAVSREFWEAIISELQAQIDALPED